MTTITVFNALNRLARSSWGKQGTGACPKKATRESLLKLGLARNVRNQPPHIMALTLKGWQVRESETYRRDMLAIRRMNKREGL